MQETLKIGLIVKPQGIRGEVKVQPLTDDINRFKNLKEVLIDGAKYRVLSSTIGGNVVFLAFSGINDRNQAEMLRGKFLCVTRENALPLEEGRYFIVDIIGCKIVTENCDCVGEVIDVFSARTDIFTVRCEDGRIMRFPFLLDTVKKVDVNAKIITVDKKRLGEVSCYED
ncbi:MAG: 16S rRNA processing protein RimM [Clostridiales bacterium]|nr:16S rRNA processing protein RimM [Clostridiales bacterium]